MAKHKRNYLKELWLNRPWKFIPAVLRYMRWYPFQKGKGNFRIWLRNCLYINWEKV